MSTGGIARRGGEVKALIGGTNPAPTIKQMCRWLKVSRSGYYEWRNRAESFTVRRREELKTLIVSVFRASDGTYGYWRVHADLVAGGRACGSELVRAPGHAYRRPTSARVPQQVGTRAAENLE